MHLLFVAVAVCAVPLALGLTACGDGAAAGGSGSGSGGSGPSSGGSSTSSGGSSSGSGSSGSSSSGSSGSSSSSSGGTSGSSGSASDDAGAGNDGSVFDGTGDSGSPSALFPAKNLVCTQFLGVSITYDWFTNGFDTAPLDTTRFQLKGVDTPGQSYIENFTDPNDPVWSAPVVSPCAASSDNPDRIVYVGVEWNFTTAAQWTTAFDGVIATFKSKYSNLKRVDIMTMLRAPNNMICPNGVSQQVVAPFLDQAIQMEAQSTPTFVGAAPAFYVPDCSDFLPNSEHLQPADYGAVAAVIRSYYASEP
jgi:hypothetical protein